MKWILIICFFTAFSSFSQNNQNEFEFLLGLERTDSLAEQFLTEYFGLLDEDEYKEMWELKDKDSDDWIFFKSDPDPDSWLYEFPLFISVYFGKISRIEVIVPKDITEESKEKWIEFYSSTMPGGFHFDLTTKEMKEKFDKKLSKKKKLIGFQTNVSEDINLEIMGIGTRKSPVRLLVYQKL